MSTARILVVEDDPSIGPRIVAALIRADYDAVLAADGTEGAVLFQGQSFDLVVLDLMLPGQDGFSLLQEWRDRSSTPVIVLTASTHLDARLRSFELGAVDWLPKPFFTEELIARIRTRLGSGPITSPRREHRVGSCVLDLDGRRVLRGDEVLALTAHEVNLLTLLVASPGRAFTRVQLADRALPADGSRTDRTVDSHIYHIRQKLGSADGALVQTVYGVGYRYTAAENE